MKTLLGNAPKPAVIIFTPEKVQAKMATSVLVTQQKMFLTNYAHAESVSMSSCCLKDKLEWRLLAKNILSDIPVNSTEDDVNS